MRPSRQQRSDVSSASDLGSTSVQMISGLSSLVPEFLTLQIQFVVKIMSKQLAATPYKAELFSLVIAALGIHSD